MNHAFVMMSFLGITAVITPNQEPAMIQHDISVYLPASDVVEGWKPVGPPQAFVGEGLYDLIDGGAVIYYEYGFKQAITQEYSNSEGESVYLQIYEMVDPASAYGIYTFKTDEEGIDIDLGNEGMVAAYYLHFWKGDFLVTLIASTSEETASGTMLTIAREVDNRIAYKGQRPSLYNLLMIEGQAPVHIYYLEGMLALSNIYYFGADDIFGLKHGVAGDFGDFKLFVLKYGDEKESSRWYKTARDEMKKGKRFENFMDYDFECSMTDANGLVVQMRGYLNYIFVYLGTPDKDPRAMFYKIENNLR